MQQTSILQPVGAQPQDPASDVMHIGILPTLTDPIIQKDSAFARMLNKIDTLTAKMDKEAEQRAIDDAIANARTLLYQILIYINRKHVNWVDNTAMRVDAVQSQLIFHDPERREDVSPRKLQRVTKNICHFFTDVPTFSSLSSELAGERGEKAHSVPDRYAAFDQCRHIMQIATQYGSAPYFQHADKFLNMARDIYKQNNRGREATDLKQILGRKCFRRS